MQSKSTFNYIVLTISLSWLLIFNVACHGNLVQPILQQQISTEVSLSEFMQAAEDFAKANNADFAKALSLLKDKYELLVDKDKLHQGQSKNGRYILQLLFANKINREIINFVHMIHSDSSNRALLLNPSSVPKPVEVLAKNQNPANENAAVIRIFRFLISNDVDSINYLSMDQKHEIFAAFKVNDVRRRSYLALTNQQDYLKDAFLKGKSSVIKKILGSLENNKAKAARTLLVKEATKLAKEDLSGEAASKLENLLKNTSDWGFSLNDIFDVNYYIITIIVDTLEDDLLEPRVQDLIKSLALAIKTVPLARSWAEFSDMAFSIINNSQNHFSRKAIRELLDIEPPYQAILDGLSSGNLAYASARLNEFLAANVEEDIKEFADLDLGAGKKPIVKIAELPANDNTSSMFEMLLTKLESININYIRAPYGPKTLLQILAGDADERGVIDHTYFLAKQVATVLKMGASMSDFGNDFIKIERILYKIEFYDKALENAFSTIDLAVMYEASRWAAKRQISAWRKMYERGDRDQKLDMRSALLDEVVKDRNGLSWFINKISDLGLGPILGDDTYNIEAGSGTLINMLVLSRKNNDELAYLYSKLIKIPDNNLLQEAFKQTPNISGNAIATWAYNNRYKEGVREAFKNYLQNSSVEEYRKIYLKKSLAAAALNGGDLFLKGIRGDAKLWGLEPNDNILTSQKLVDDAFDNLVTNDALLASVQRYFDGVDTPDKVIYLINASTTKQNTILHALAFRFQDQDTWQAMDKIINSIAANNHYDLVDFINHENSDRKSVLTVWLEQDECNNFCGKSITLLSLISAKILPWDLKLAIKQLEITHEYGDEIDLTYGMKSFKKEELTAIKVVKWLSRHNDEKAREAIKGYVNYLRNIINDHASIRSERLEAVQMMSLLRREINPAIIKELNLD